VVDDVTIGSQHELGARRAIDERREDANPFTVKLGDRLRPPHRSGSKAE